jgi:large repetitive protein
MKKPAISKTTAISSLCATIAVLLISGTAFAAARATGYAAVKVRFNDGAAWQVDRSTGQIGLVNQIVDVSSDVIRVAGRGELLEIEQGSAALVALNRSNGTLRIVDDRLLQFSGDPIKIANPITARVTSNRVVLFDRSLGKLWITAPDDLAKAGSLEKLTPAFNGGGPGEMEVSVNGTIAVALEKNHELRVFEDNGALLAVRDVITVTARTQLSFVGTTPIVFDAATGTLRIIGSRIRTVELGIDNGEIAMPSAASQTTTAIDQTGRPIKIDIRSGRIDRLPLAIGANPIRPLISNGCFAYASQATGTAASMCGDRKTIVQQFAPGAELVGRLVNDRAWIDDVNGPVTIAFRTDGSIQPLESLAPDSGPANDEVLSIRPTDPVVAQTTDSTDNLGKNDPPTAADDRVRVRPERTSLLRVLTNDRDPDGDPITIREIRGAPGNVSAEVAPDGGSIVFRAASGFQGTVSFEYVIADPSGLTSSAEVSVAVDGTTNEAPTPQSDRVAAQAQHASIIDVLGNDSDPDGDSLNVVDARSISASIAIGASGFLAVTPLTAGVVTVDYDVQDERGLRGSAQLVLDVSPNGTNRAPIATADFFRAQIGRPITLDVLSNDNDPEGATLTLSNVPSSAGSIGALSVSGSTITFTPAELGSAKFSYTVSDGEAAAKADVALSVGTGTQNRAPIALPDQAMLSTGETAAINVVANDRDPDGDVLGIASFTSPPELEVSSFDGRTLVFSAQQSLLKPVVVNYEVSDGSLSSQGTVLVSMATVPGNLAPIARNDKIELRKVAGGTVSPLMNDVDPEGRPLKIVNVSERPGLLVDASQQTVSVLPESLLSGSFSFTYDVIDEIGQRASATVNVVVIEEEVANRVPVARADLLTVRNRNALIAVLKNDSDADGDALSIISVGNPARGTVSIERDGLRYEAFPSSSGTDRFTYTLSDGNGGTAAAEVTVGILPAPTQNQPPVAVDDGPFVITSGQTIEIQPLANDSDPNGDALALSSISTPSLGSLRRQGSELVFVAPAVSVATLITASYTITDTVGASASARITFEVKAKSSGGLAPIAVADQTDPLRPGVVIELSILDNDTDPDGDQRALRIVSIGKGATISGGGRTATITAGTKTQTIPYTIQDNQGLKGQGAVTVLVAKNLPPRALNDRASTNSGEAVMIDVLANDLDPESEPLSISSVSSDASADISAAGSKVSFSPKRGFVGKTTFTYVVSDPSGNKGSASVEVNVKPVGSPRNAAPEVHGTTIRLRPSSTVTIDLTTLARDPEGTKLFFDLPATGKVFVSTLANSTLTITAPERSDIDSEELLFAATDGEGESQQARIRVELIAALPTTTTTTTTAPRPTVAPPVSTGSPAPAPITIGPRPNPPAASSPTTQAGGVAPVPTTSFNEPVTTRQIATPPRVAATTTSPAVTTALSNPVGPPTTTAALPATTLPIAATPTSGALATIAGTKPTEAPPTTIASSTPTQPPAPITPTTEGSDRGGNGGRRGNSGTTTTISVGVVGTVPPAPVTPSTPTTLSPSISTPNVTTPIPPSTDIPRSTVPRTTQTTVAQTANPNVVTTTNISTTVAPGVPNGTTTSIATNAPSSTTPPTQTTTPSASGTTTTVQTSGPSIAGASSSTALVAASSTTTIPTSAVSSTSGAPAVTTTTPPTAAPTTTTAITVAPTAAPTNPPTTATTIAPPPAAIITFTAFGTNDATVTFGVPGNAGDVTCSMTVSPGGSVDNPSSCTGSHISNLASGVSYLVTITTFRGGQAAASTTGFTTVVITTVAPTSPPATDPPTTLPPDTTVAPTNPPPPTGPNGTQLISHEFVRCLPRPAAQYRDTYANGYVTFVFINGPCGPFV